MITIRPPSNQKPYDEYWSGDSAFVQPDVRDADTLRIHNDRILQCRRTGDWSAQKVAGREPTKFVMRLIDGNQLRWVQDRREVGGERAMGDATTIALAFRCALLEVHNLGIDFKVNFEEHPYLGRIADANIVSVLDASDPGIVSELGLVALWRARQIDPL